MLVEVSSGLTWNCVYELQSEITSAAAFCLLELGSHEKFFNSVYDSLLPTAGQIYSSKQERRLKADWNTIDDTSP